MDARITFSRRPSSIVANLQTIAAGRATCGAGDPRTGTRTVADKSIGDAMATLTLGAIEPWWCVVATGCLLTLAGCAQAPAPASTPELDAMQQRLRTLEQRVEVLERYIWNLPSPANRSREEIERNIKSLEAKRAALLQRYTNAHPEVREIDLSLRLLQLQIQTMDQAAKNPK